MAPPLGGYFSEACQATQHSQLLGTLADVCHHLPFGTSAGHICLCDFGSCKSMQQLEEINDRLLKDESHGDAVQFLLQQFSGTVEYLAPEIVTAQRVSPAADLWALGCLAFQLLASYLPFYAGAVDCFCPVGGCLRGNGCQKTFIYSPDMLPGPGQARSQALGKACGPGT